MEISQEALTDLLTCPGCKEIPVGPTFIFQCSKGHLVCGSCRGKMEKTWNCQRPDCNADIASTRNLFAEKLLENVNVDCKYKTSGCPMKLVGTAPRQVHHQKCSFRPIICQIQLVKNVRCNQEVEFHKYLQHILRDHSGLSLVEPTEPNCYAVTQMLPYDVVKASIRIIPKDLPPILHMKNNGKDFYVVTDTYNSVTPFWSLYFVDSDMLADNWATLSVHHPVTKVELSFVAPARSIRSTAEDICKSGMNLTIHGNSFKAVAHYYPDKKCSEWNLSVLFHHGQGDSGNRFASAATKQDTLQQLLGVGVTPAESYCDNASAGTNQETLQQLPGVTRPRSYCDNAEEKILENSFGSSTPPQESFASEEISCDLTDSSSKVSDKIEIPNSITDSISAAAPASASDSGKIIDLGIQADFVAKKGCAVCIIRGKNKMDSVYSMFSKVFDGKDKIAKTDVEFQAQSAIEAFKQFKTLFKPKTNVYISCPAGISDTQNRVSGSFVQALHLQLDNLLKSREGLRFVFKDYDAKKLEAIAVRQLLVSSTLCSKVLDIEGFTKIESAALPEPKAQAPNPVFPILPSTIKNPVVPFAREIPPIQAELKRSASTDSNRQTISPAPKSTMRIGLQASFQKKIGGGVITIYTPYLPSAYSTCMTTLHNSHAIDSQEFQAHNAIQVMKEFKKFFTPGSTINVLCPYSLNSEGRKGSYTSIFQEQLTNLSKGGKSFLFPKYKPNALEAVAVDSLLVSTVTCTHKLRSAGLVDVFEVDSSVPYVASALLTSGKVLPQNLKKTGMGSQELSLSSSSSRSASVAGSTTSHTFELNQDTAIAPRPQSASPKPFPTLGSKKTIDLAVTTDNGWMWAGFMCVIREEGKVPVYSALREANSTNNTGFDWDEEVAKYTLTVLEKLNKHLRNCSKLTIFTEVTIIPANPSLVKESQSTSMEKLNGLLSNIRESGVQTELVKFDFSETNLELNVARELIRASDDSCAELSEKIMKEIKEAGLREIDL